MISRLNSELAEVRRARPFLGTLVEIRASGADPQQLTSAVESAFGVVARVHRLMSFHDTESDVTRLNREGADRAVTVDLWTWHVLAQAQAMYVASEGLFDITVAPLLMKWGYLPPGRGGTRSIAGANAEHIKLLTENRVRFTRRLAIDLGGIAKGFAVDMAIAELRAGGVERAVVNAGGDLRVFGAQSELVHVRHPESPGQMVRLVELRDAALATSAHYFARKQWRGQEVSPLVDALQQRPCRFGGSVSVMAPTCLMADALTKVVMMAREDCRSILAAFNAEAFMVTGTAAKSGSARDSHAV